MPSKRKQVAPRRDAFLSPLFRQISVESAKVRTSGADDRLILVIGTHVHPLGSDVTKQTNVTEAELLMDLDFSKWLRDRLDKWIKEREEYVGKSKTNA